MTSSEASTSHASIRLVDSGDVVLIDYAQEENGSAASSRIVTTTGTATRNVEIYYIANPLPSGLRNDFCFGSTISGEGGPGYAPIVAGLAVSAGWESTNSWRFGIDTFDLTAGQAQVQVNGASGWRKRRTTASDHTPFAVEAWRWQEAANVTTSVFKKDGSTKANTNVGSGDGIMAGTQTYLSIGSGDTFGTYDLNGTLWNMQLGQVDACQ